MQTLLDRTADVRNAVTFVEDTDPLSQYTFKLESVVARERTAYQDVLICDTYAFGRMLVLDGAIQSSEDDEDLYHELLVQPAMVCHPNPEHVLIIGGGEGASLREVLAHRSVKKAVMVDLDQRAVELCREHLEDWHEGAFDDERAHLVFEDGRAFLERNETKYDVIVIDVVDMLDNGPAQALYTKQFYSIVRERLNPGGIVVVQGMEFSFLDSQPHAALARTLRTMFPQVHSYAHTIPSFLSAWGFIIASDWLDLRALTAEEFDRKLESKLDPIWLDHMDGAFLKASCTFSKLTQKKLEEPGQILEDGVEFIVYDEWEDD